jgi:hypothetical protein
MAFTRGEGLPQRAPCQKLDHLVYTIGLPLTEPIATPTSLGTCLSE